MSATRTIGRYALHGEIAAGGMATVHLGQLLGSGGMSRLVAIKRLHAQFAKDPEFVKMFIDEGRLASRIHHPNVVGLLDLVSLEGELFLVMEYVQGESLSTLTRATLKRNERVPLRIVASIVVGVLQGLHAAHIAKSEAGEPLNIVHRDVSPQNVLVSVDGVARVLDFGVAKAVGRLQTTREGQIKGKIAYMAPEQLRSEAVDHRADIYSVGVVLWEMLAGRRLFRGDSEGAVLTQILVGTPSPPSSVVPDIPKDWDDIVMKAISRDPNERYATGEEMADAIESAQGVASGRVVAQWIAEIAGESLARREKAVQQIEQVKDISALASGDALPLIEAYGAASSPSGSSMADAKSAALYSPSPSTPPELGTAAPTLLVQSRVSAVRPKRATPIAVAIGGLLLVGGVVLFARGRGHGPSSATPTITAPEAASSTSMAAVPTPAPSSEMTAKPVDSSVVAAPASASAQPISMKTNGTRHAPVVASPPAPAVTSKPTTKANCQNPFVVDANGDTHVRRECL